MNDEYLIEEADKYEDAECFLAWAHNGIDEFDAKGDANRLARGQLWALMSIAESVLTLTKHLTKESTQKEEGTP